jgi:hypothetical protein
MSLLLLICEWKKTASEWQVTRQGQDMPTQAYKNITEISASTVWERHGRKAYDQEKDKKWTMDRHYPGEPASSYENSTSLRVQAWECNTTSM